MNLKIYNQILTENLNRAVLIKQHQDQQRRQLQILREKINQVKK